MAARIFGPRPRKLESHRRAMTEFMTDAGRSGGVTPRWPGAIAWLFAASLSGLVAGGAAAQAPSDPVVYCRDPVRQIVIRALARDCPDGAVISEKEAEALKNESVERRRRLMFGEKPEAVPAAPVEPVRETPPERAAPPPSVCMPGFPDR